MHLKQLNHVQYIRVLTYVSILLLATLSVAMSPLASAKVRSDRVGREILAQGTVEAVRHSELAVQVAGNIAAVMIKPGERVRAGQLLVRIEAKVAEQMARAARAQADAAKAGLDIASKEYARQQQLFEKQYISQAAMERAEAKFKSAQAQYSAGIASARAATSQSGFFNITAPYAGIVADVPANVGEMALPGRTLVSIYDPATLRVSATVPQSQMTEKGAVSGVRVEIPELAQARELKATTVTVFPAADASTHSIQLRAELPVNLTGVIPGTFARVWISGAGGSDTHLYVPAQAVFQRAEMKLVYVLNPQGKPLLRQIKAGHQAGNEIEVLAGLSAGERVALDPVAAAR